MSGLLPWLLWVPSSWEIHSEQFIWSLSGLDSSRSSSRFPNESAKLLIRVFIKCAKIDPFRHGCFIFLGRSSAPLCPVSVLTNYLHLRGPGTGPAFIFQEGCPLSGAVLSLFLQATLQAAGILGKFSGHSFRIGATTTAAQRGVPGHLIKTMGRRSSEADLLYVRTPVDPNSYDSCVNYKRLVAGCLQTWALFFVGVWLCFGHEPHSLLASHCLAWRSFGMAWGPMAGLPGFASHGSSLHLGAGCQ